MHLRPQSFGSGIVMRVRSKASQRDLDGRCLEIHVFPEIVNLIATLSNGDGVQARDESMGPSPDEYTGKGPQGTWPLKQRI